MYIKSGQRFSKLVAKNDIAKAKDFGIFICDCGNEVERSASQVKSSLAVQTCGCKGRQQFKIGDKFNRLTLLENVIKTTYYYEFKCDCGNLKKIRFDQVRDKLIKSCGCLGKHGMSKTSTYNSWMAMKQRCGETEGETYQNYAKRGISYVDSWNSFLNFYEDMGEKPVGTELDRINNDLGYFKENCRWVSRKRNSNNKRSNRYLEAFGEVKTMMEWSEDPRCSVSYQTLNNRTYYGWDDLRAITEPLNEVKNQWNK